MPVSAETLSKLLAAGVTGDALIDLVASIDADHAAMTARAANDEPKRSTNAIRQQRWRERQALQSVTSNVTNNGKSVTESVTNNVTETPSLSPKKVSPTPPSKNNPLPNPQTSLAVANSVLARDGFDVDEAFRDWNTLAAHTNGVLPQAKTLNKTRRASLRKRLEECGGNEGWRDVLRLIPKSDFLMGSNNSGFTASLDFVLQASSFTKLREGTYAKRGAGPVEKPTTAQGFTDLAEFYRAQALREGDHSGSTDSTIQDVPKLAHHRA